MQAVFEINNISFYYADLKAIDDLSLTIDSGSFWGIVGPNGCGKTTLLDLMIREKVPAAGTISYRGRNLADYGRKELAKEMALVPQDFYINFSFTVEEIVLMGRHPYIPRFAAPSSDDLKIVDQVMALLEIDGFKHKYVTELSGGERQRVIFARALAQDTSVLLLDEAISNMDIQHTLYTLDVVANDVQAKGKTVIAALHNLNLAATFCDKLIFMKSGRVVSLGDTTDVLTEENVRKVFGIDCHIYFDDYSGAKQVIFKRRQKR